MVAMLEVDLREIEWLVSFFARESMGAYGLDNSEFPFVRVSNHSLIRIAGVGVALYY